ncbi:MAG: Helix-turn-helix domain [Acidimicrobiaceae bacterium]|nr:Helix-turn-helix domain [Acidimicrobiaceae bacterium]
MDLDPVLVRWGDNIRRRRAEFEDDHTQGWLARACRVSLNTVWRWEHGYMEPHRRMKARIAEALETDVETLFPGNH